MALELTKELLADLKIARSIVLRFEHDRDHSTIDVFTGNIGNSDDRRVTYPLPVSWHFNYVGTWHVFSYPNQATPLTTFIESLKPGDLLDFRLDDYRNTYIENAGLIHDVLVCNVTRKRKNSDTPLFNREFFIDSQVVPTEQRNLNKRMEQTA